MTTLITVVVLYALALLLCWAICADSKNRDQRHVTVWGEHSDRPTADALAAAIETHINNGGQLFDLVGYQAEWHPSGAVHVRLITRDDAEHVADEAETFLRSGGAA